MNAQLPLLVGGCCSCVASETREPKFKTPLFLNDGCFYCNTGAVKPEHIFNDKEFNFTQQDVAELL